MSACFAGEIKPLGMSIEEISYLYSGNLNKAGICQPLEHVRDPPSLRSCGALLGTFRTFSGYFYRVLPFWSIDFETILVRVIAKQ
jgi:hypothetical protein